MKRLTPRLAAWPLRNHTALKSILWETLFLNQHDFLNIIVKFIFTSLLKIISREKNPWHQKISFSKSDFHKPTYKHRQHAS